MQRNADASNMNRYTAYRAEAAKCRLRAEADEERRLYWIAEAEKWERRAEEAEIS